MSTQNPLQDPLENPEKITRVRKPRKNLLWVENDYVVVFLAGQPAKWIGRCKNCGSSHEQQSRSIQKNYMPRACPAYAPRTKIYKNIEDSKLVLKYGITFDDFKAMLKNQNYKCEICGIHQAELHYRMNVDHDHSTGKVRGLLCRPCNHAIGLLKDDPRNAARASEYLKLHKT